VSTHSGQEVSVLSRRTFPELADSSVLSVDSRKQQWSKDRSLGNLSRCTTLYNIPDIAQINSFENSPCSFLLYEDHDRIYPSTSSNVFIVYWPRVSFIAFWSQAGFYDKYLTINHWFVSSELHVRVFWNIQHSLHTLETIRFTTNVSFILKTT